MQNLYVKSYDRLMKDKRKLQTKGTPHACELGNSMQRTCHLLEINLLFLLNYSKVQNKVSCGCL